MGRASIRAHIGRANGDEAGLSLLELVMAITIFGILMLGIAQTLGMGLQLTRTDRHRSVAANLASQDMDAIRSADFADVVAKSYTTSVDGVNYDVNRSLTWETKSATSGPCNTTNPNPQVLRVHVSVTWPNMSGVRPVVSDTVLAPPIGSFDPNTGHIAVKVTDRDGNPTQFVTVQQTGPESQTTLTDGDGCAFLAFLPAGTYTIKLSEPGYVDPKMNPTPTITSAVVVGATKAAPFQYDRAARIDVTMAGGAGTPIPNDLPVTVWSNNSKNVTIAGVGATRTINGLFPFSSGYYAWAGSCADADPEGDHIVDDGSGAPKNLGKYWPGATRGTLMSVDAGGSATTTLGLHDAAVHVVNAGGVAQAGVTVVAVHDSDNVCSGATHVLGTTDAAGNLTAALPFGTWKLQVQGKSPSGSWPSTVLDPRDLTPTSTTVTTL
jgi:Tfp pilus assembly protein PilV